METRIFVVHLPQYFQVEEDFTGTGRLTGILCKIYGLPSRLEDRERGIDQYASLQNMVADTTEFPACCNGWRSGTTGKTAARLPRRTKRRPFLPRSRRSYTDWTRTSSPTRTPSLK